MKLLNNDGNTVLAVVLMSIGLWLFGSVIASGFMAIVKSYDTALKNDDWFIMVMSIGWTMYCFCNGYLKNQGCQKIITNAHINEPIKKQYKKMSKEQNSIKEPNLTGDGMNSLEFFDMIKKEWCISKEQYKPFWNDVLTFARKYHNERKVYNDKHPD